MSGNTTDREGELEGGARTGRGRSGEDSSVGQARHLDAVRLGIERLEMSGTYQKAEIERLDEQVRVLGEILRDVQQDSTRLCEWARVKENMIQLEEQQKRQANEAAASRLAAIETKVGGLLRDKERVVTWSAGALAGYVAWRGTAAKDLLHKLLGLLQ